MKTVYLLLSLLLAVKVSAQQLDMRQVFKAMPDSIVPYLSENNRLDFIDFMDSNMAAQVDNTLQGRSTMTRLTDRYTQVRLNEASQLELMLLPVAEPVDSASQVICMVRTYGKDQRESSVAFYSVKWNRLDASAYIDYDVTGSFEAQLTDADQAAAEPRLTIQPFSYADTPANEEQQSSPKTSITLKWKSRFVKE